PAQVGVQRRRRLRGRDADQIEAKLQRSGFQPFGRKKHVLKVFVLSEAAIVPDGGNANRAQVAGHGEKAGAVSGKAVSSYSLHCPGGFYLRGTRARMLVSTS